MDQNQIDDASQNSFVFLVTTDVADSQENIVLAELQSVTFTNHCSYMAWRQIAQNSR